MRRRPRRPPVSRACGARPARLAMARRSSRPSSGSRAVSTAAIAGPTPGAVRTSAVRSALVHLAKQRWLIERDYLELKQELGLGHYEGRGWRGFHHHAALCIAAYGFLLAERAALPPSGASIGRLVKAAAVPGHQQPRGSPTTFRAARARTRSRRCEGASHTRLLSCCHNVRAAIDQCNRHSPIHLVCDAVRLEQVGFLSCSQAKLFQFLEDTLHPVRREQSEQKLSGLIGT